MENVDLNHTVEKQFVATLMSDAQEVYSGRVFVKVPIGKTKPGMFDMFVETHAAGIAIFQAHKQYLDRCMESGEARKRVTAVMLTGVTA